jgi:hypothetical protein
VELLDFYLKPRTFRMIRSIRKKWVEHVARVGKLKDACKSFGGEKMKERDLLKYLGVDGKIMLKFIFKQ